MANLLTRGKDKVKDAAKKTPEKFKEMGRDIKRKTSKASMNIDNSFKKSPITSEGRVGRRKDPNVVVDDPVPPLPFTEPTASPALSDGTTRMRSNTRSSHVQDRERSESRRRRPRRKAQAQAQLDQAEAEAEAEAEVEAETRRNNNLQGDDTSGGTVGLGIQTAGGTTGPTGGSIAQSLPYRTAAPGKSSSSHPLYNTSKRVPVAKGVRPQDRAEAPPRGDKKGPSSRQQSSGIDIPDSDGSDCPGSFASEASTQRLEDRNSIAVAVTSNRRVQNWTDPTKGKGPGQG